MDESLVGQLLGELESYGIACDEKSARLMVSHLSLLIEKNKVLNLTRITDPSDAITLHYVDSLLPLATKTLRDYRVTSFLDLGTGGGFPGIPFGILTGSKGVLLDSVGKKVAAVAEFARELDLDGLEAMHARVEDLALQRPHSFDVVLARAVAQTNVLIEYAAPLLRKNGLLVVEKGRPEDDEMRCAGAAARLCGLTLLSQDSFELPRDLGHREILIFKRVGAPRVKLPRKPGMAKKDPLGATS